MPTVNEQKVSQWLSDFIYAQGITKADLAKSAGVDGGTVGDFLAGKRWPVPGTRSAIEEALALKLGTLDRIKRTGEIPDDVRGSGQGALLDVPEAALEGLSEAEREEVRAAMIETAMRRAREIRQSH